MYVHVKRNEIIDMINNTEHIIDKGKYNIFSFNYQADEGSKKRRW